MYQSSGQKVEVATALWLSKSDKARRATSGLSAVFLGETEIDVVALMSVSENLPAVLLLQSCQSAGQ